MMIKVILEKSKVVKCILEGIKRLNFFSFIFYKSILIFPIF